MMAWMAFRVKAGELSHRIGMELDRVYAQMAEAYSHERRRPLLYGLAEEERWLLRALFERAPGRKPDWALEGEACRRLAEQARWSSTTVPVSEVLSVIKGLRCSSPAGRAGRTHRREGPLAVQVVADPDEVFDLDAATQEQLFRLRTYAEDFDGRLGYDHCKMENKAPRYSQWRPLRYSVFDSLFGFADFCYNRSRASVDVRCYGVICHSGADVFAGTRGVLVNLLGEAAGRGAAGMQFLRPEDPSNPEARLVPDAVPADILVFALLLPAPVAIDRGGGHLSQEQINGILGQLAAPPASGATARPAHEALMVVSGKWTEAELESLRAKLPGFMVQGLLRGRFAAEHGVVFFEALQHVRAATFCGIVDRYVRGAAERAGGVATVVEASPSVLGGRYGRTYEGSVPVDWQALTWGENSPHLEPRCEVPAGRRFTVATRAGDWAELWRWRAEDLRAAAQAATEVVKDGKSVRRGLAAVPRDLMYLPPQDLHAYLDLADELGVFVLPLDVTRDELEAEAVGRLERMGRSE